MGQVERVEVVEYTDVMCSWAWGSEPKLRLLRWRYAAAAPLALRGPLRLAAGDGRTG